MNKLDTIKSQLRQEAGLTEKSANTCCSCGQPFSTANVFTPAGWRETKITGLCESCFDAMYGDED